MKPPRKPPASTAELRRRAEEELAAHRGGQAAAPTIPEAHRLLHELAVHRIELEVQNEELLTARAETEAALERYTELFDFAPIGYATLAGDSTIREINHAGARLLGKERARFVGKSFGALVEARDVPSFRALLAKAREGESSAGCELGLALAERGPVYVRLTATVLARGEALIMLAFEDITERHARDEALARSQAALRDADRRKDDFLAALSHELRNPLTPIGNSLLVLELAPPGTAQARKAQEVIGRQVTHLTRLIDDLLDITRITRQKLRLKCRRVDLTELVRRTVEDHRASFEADRIRIDSNANPGALWVDADPERLNQVMSNVLGNAAKFTPAGGSVLVSIQPGGLGAELRVRDTGSGIPPDLIEHLFEPFAQAPQTLARSRGGLGLGLAMVKGIIELHGGTVGLTSEGIGRGTEVIISLPLATAPAHPPAPVATPPTPQRRVLVIEDNLDAAESLAAALALSGHDVMLASDGVSGIARARSFQPEIVICDLGLPGMDGYEVACAFRSDPGLERIYLIALSGYAQDTDVQRAIAAGFDQHLAKPPDLRTLYRLVHEAPRDPREPNPGP
jgi:PAS domain S-box-containing protein